MNNLEIFDDFAALLLKIHNRTLSASEEHLIRMAINHTMLIMQDEEE